MPKECVRICEEDGKLQESLRAFIPFFATLISLPQTLMMKTVNIQTRRGYAAVPAIRRAALGLAR
jgi:hypothetical protein